MDNQMNQMKDDAYYSGKMLRDLRYVKQHMEGISESVFSENEILQDAMMFRLIQISESARKMSEEYKACHEQIPWVDVFGLRNRIVHDYGTVDLHIVYTTLTSDVSDLISMIEER